MGIKAIKGRIMDTAPSNSEAVAVWMYKGFNTRYAIWGFEIKERDIRLELIYPNDFMHSENSLESAYKTKTKCEPWRLTYGTLWKITNRNQGKLKYIYIFPNPEDKQRLENLDEIDELIKRCFTTLNENSINSVSLILIPALSRGEHNTELEDIKSAEQMICSIKNWLSENEEDMNVYLVDRVDGFRNVIERFDS